MRSGRTMSCTLDDRGCGNSFFGRKRWDNTWPGWWHTEATSALSVFEQICLMGGASLRRYPSRPIILESTADKVEQTCICKNSQTDSIISEDPDAWKGTLQGCRGNFPHNRSRQRSWLGALRAKNSYAMHFKCGTKRHFHLYRFGDAENCMMIWPPA